MSKNNGLPRRFTPRNDDIKNLTGASGDDAKLHRGVLALSHRKQ